MRILPCSGHSLSARVLGKSMLQHGSGAVRSCQEHWVRYKGIQTQGSRVLSVGNCPDVSWWDLQNKTHKPKMDAWAPILAIKIHLVWVGPQASVLAKLPTQFSYAARSGEQGWRGKWDPGGFSPDKSPPTTKQCGQGSVFWSAGSPRPGFNLGSAICCENFAKWVDFSKFSFFHLWKGMIKMGLTSTCVNRRKRLSLVF